MFGFACDETPGLMPATLYYSHRIFECMAADRHGRHVDFLEPDAKSQVTLAYENGMPVRATALVVSTQNAVGADKRKLSDYVKGVLAVVLHDGWLTVDRSEECGVGKECVSVCRYRCRGE